MRFSSNGLGLRLLSVMACVALSGLIVSQPLRAEVQYSPPGRAQSIYFGAVDALAMQAYGRAELTRANGESAVNYAAARNLHADAYRKELDNLLATKLETARTHWRLRSISQEQKQKLQYNYVKATRRADSKHWETLKDHPGASRARVVSGEELNWMLQKFFSNILAASYSQLYVRSVDRNHPDLKISPEMLHGLQLKQNRVGTKFRADEGVGLQLDYIPWLLRTSEFDSRRRAMTEQRDHLLSEAQTGATSRESLIGMENSVTKLQQSLRDSWPEKPRFPEWVRYNDSRKKLTELSNQVEALKDFVGTSTGLDGKLRFQVEKDGTDLITFLQFMKQNALAFAPANPTDEAAYQKLFFMMRDLYANLAEDDPNIQDDPNYQRLTPTQY